MEVVENIKFTPPPKKRSVTMMKEIDIIKVYHLSA